jgi:hypothetical protein
MRAILLASTAAFAVLAVVGPVAGQGPGAAGKPAPGREVTGTVERFDEDKGWLIVDGETFVLEKSGPLTLSPTVGERITLFYEERDGRKVVTQIGQKR